MSRADPRHDVSDMANELEISEREVFRRAYLAWYGVEPSFKDVEHAFGRYLMAGIVPMYVTHLCRQTRELVA